MNMNHISDVRHSNGDLSVKCSNHFGSKTEGSTTKCIICDASIQEQKYAIRDYNGAETYAQWIIRHVKHLLTLGFYKYVPFHLPVCDHCVSSYAKKFIVLKEDS